MINGISVFNLKMIIMKYSGFEVLKYTKEKNGKTLLFQKLLVWDIVSKAIQLSKSY